MTLLGYKVVYGIRRLKGDSAGQCFIIRLLDIINLKETFLCLLVKNVVYMKTFLLLNYFINYVLQLCFCLEDL